MNPGVGRAYYFTSVVGDGNALHEIRVALRNFDLEPCVFPEATDLAKQRRNVLENESIIEKAKKVDIALAVRMLEDSVHSFDVCHLYTSDIDFLPVIQAVRSRGKKVYVHGYKAGLGKQSPFLHECDLFTDLADMLREECEMVHSS